MQLAKAYSLSILPCPIKDLHLLGENATKCMREVISRRDSNDTINRKNLKTGTDMF